MPTVVSCECGQRFQAADWLAGREIPCPSCGQTLSVPGSPSEAADPTPATPAPAAASAEKIVVACKCGKKFQAGAKLMGKVVKCPGCGNPLKVQRAAAGAVAAKSAAAKPATAGRAAPAKPAPAANTDPLAMDLSTFDSAAFDQGGLGGGFDQGGLGSADLGGMDLSQGGFGAPGFDQVGFDQGGSGQPGFGQAGLGSPLDSMSMDYGQQQMGAGATSEAQPQASGGGSFELSPRMLVILMSVAGGAVVLLLLAIFIPPLYTALTTPAEVNPPPVASVPGETPAADAGPLTWTPYASPSGEYSVDFPGTPATSATTPNSFGALAGVDSPASVHMPSRGEYSVGRVPLAQPIEPVKSRKIMIKNSMDTAGTSGMLTFVLRKDILVQGNPGIEARIEGKNQDRDFDGLCRMIMTKTHLYFVVYAAPKGKFNQEDANRFLNSFKLTSAN